MAKTKEEYMSDFKRWGLLGGRPRSFKSPKDMAEKIAEWLETTENRCIGHLTRDGKVVEVREPGEILVESFCDYCGITKQTFYAYRAKPEFVPLIEFVRQKVEKYLAVQCVNGKPGNKADFILRNAFGDVWKEKSELTINPVSSIKFVVEHIT